jgi:hypothetical protein
MERWFELHSLERTQCHAALAFPEAAPSTEKSIKRLRVLAALYNVEVVEFTRPA